MKRQLDLHGNVVASFCLATRDALTVARRGAHREARCQMDTIGLDLHKRESQLCIGQIFSNAVSQRVDVLSPNGTRDFGGRVILADLAAVTQPATEVHSLPNRRRLQTGPGRRRIGRRLHGGYPRYPTEAASLHSGALGRCRERRGCATLLRTGRGVGRDPLLPSWGGPTREGGA